ncbi:Rid family detoxifying hydrolase [Liquorilactobacillus satsumensis]|nr:Rid family detoxifying hydrolase [Liquorilactobacillus satsumensis]MCP9313752.1 Rid family detoxifying hydrolase [Liquorilactobacillus satsumensis]MCP9360893.1 Rid family detoxifying hydrolase [Liquorilactobacillus satsumensis]
MKIINTSQAPQAIGPYSQAIIHQGMLYISGQGPLFATTKEIPEGITAQAQLACQNVEAILTAGKSDFQQVIKTTCFLSDMHDFNQFNQVYGKYFISKPARSCVAVKDLPAGILCEIEVIAISNDTKS